MRLLHALALATLALIPGVPDPSAHAQQRGTAEVRAATPPVRFPRSWDLQPGTIAPVHATRGMVVTTDRVVSEIGAEILRRGGNAVDAAVATHFALAVANPEAGNIGGGGFLMVRMANGTVAALDFRETAPMAATRDMFLDASGNPTDRSTVGHLAAGVPGSVAGMWEAHRRFGSRPWAELLQPAIALAEGMVVHSRLATSLAAYADRFDDYPATASIFLPNGAAPRVGERLVQRDLAETLRRIAGQGTSGFYGGKTADLVAEEMRRGGGLITRADLTRYRAVWREPVRFRYRGFEVISMPPPSSGGATVAEVLNILQGYDLRALGYHSAAHVHLFAEAARRAFADRNAVLADPDMVPNQPVARMISDAYAAERRATIRRDRATPSSSVTPGLAVPRREGENTTHFSVVDAQGNAVAVTTTLNCLYGNRVVVAGAGFLLNCEMDDFTVKPGTPNMFGLVQGEVNAIQPGKRMLSAMTPTLLMDSVGRVRMVTGSPGGSTIITTVAQMISNVVDWRMDAATATLAPRLHHQHLPDALQYERGGLEPEVAAELARMGHAVRERDGYQGDVQTIVVLPNGVLSGVADPRRGGAAAGVGEVRRVVH